MKTKFSLLILLLFFVSPLGLNSLLAADTYPYKTSPHCPNCQADPWAFFKRECVSYTAHKINESGTSFHNHMQGPNGVTGQFGHAGNWDNNATNIGFTVNSTPSVGAVAVWNPNSGAGMPVGHVAWIESVNPNNTVNITEYNFAVPYGYGTRSGVSANQYFHLNSGSCTGSTITIQNQTITSNLSCQASDSIIVLPDTTFQLGSDVRLYIN